MHFYAIFTPFNICTQLQNKKHTLFFPSLHTKARQLAHLRLAISNHPPRVISRPPAFPSYFALFGLNSRAESGESAADQNDIKAQFSVQDGL